MDIPILQPRHQWACPNCTQQDVTTESRPHSRMHACAGMSGITAPMISAHLVEDRAAKVTAKVREDYEGREIVTRDDRGRPIMAVETEYADGHTDLAVLAPAVNVEVIQ